jgi:hypothetical protein
VGAMIQGERKWWCVTLCTDGQCRSVHIAGAHEGWDLWRPDRAETDMERPAVVIWSPSSKILVHVELSVSYETTVVSPKHKTTSVLSCASMKLGWGGRVYSWGLEAGPWGFHDILGEGSACIWVEHRSETFHRCGG